MIVVGASLASLNINRNYMMLMAIIGGFLLVLMIGCKHYKMVDSEFEKVDLETFKDFFREKL